MHQLAGAAHCVHRADRISRGQYFRVIQLGHKAFVHVAQGVYPLTVAGFGRHDLDVGNVLAQETASAHQRARGA
ncbi:Uncharacterised protein [Mycobacterium tuberculosis]|nr:Uncharacterised protein [Mycobacterium tuberculosis]